MTDHWACLNCGTSNPHYRLACIKCHRDRTVSPGRADE